MKFYVIIIGTEILNGRRVDKHFAFVQEELSKYSKEIFAKFVIKDDVELIKNCFELVKKDKEAILFSFGGIGSTPDDLTRAIASDVFRGEPLVTHQTFYQDVVERFKEEAYPHRIHMADLPPKSQLLFNPVNNMSGFSLDEKYFFVPGFPQMSHPMISEVIKTKFNKKDIKFRLTLLAKTSENTLITLMQKLPPEIELSSLPIIKKDDISVELSLSSANEELLKHYFQLFENELKRLKISYKLSQ